MRRCSRRLRDRVDSGLQACIGPEPLLSNHFESPSSVLLNLQETNAMLCGPGLLHAISTLTPLSPSRDVWLVVECESAGALWVYLKRCGYTGVDKTCGVGEAITRMRSTFDIATELQMYAVADHHTLQRSFRGHPCRIELIITVNPPAHFLLNLRNSESLKMAFSACLHASQLL